MATEVQSNQHMRHLALVGAFLTLSACGSPLLQSGSTSPSVAASPSTAASLSPSAEATPTSGAFLDRTLRLLVNLDCRLPAKLALDTMPGFLDMRNGHFLSDQSAGSGGTYSWPARRWLPVRHDQVAPDGTHYAYVGEITPPGGPDFPPQSEGNLHVVDVAAGTDRIVLKGATLGPTGQTYAVWGVVQYAAEGVYIEKQAYQSEGLYGLWLVNPDTGSSRQILPETVRDFSFGSGAAWAGTVPPYNNTTVYRIDLATGARTEWFSKPSPFVWYEGSDASGRPLMMWQQGPAAVSEIWVLPGPSQGSKLYSGPQSTMPFPPAATDSHGVWFGSLDGASALWLLDVNGKFVKVAESPVQPLGNCQ